MATPVAVRATSSAGSPTNPLARVGQGLWRLFTSVDFAVIQIIVLALLAVVGMTVRQLPDFAFRSAGDYLAAMDAIHARYDPTFGPGVVSVLERLGVFAMFRSPWFSLGLLVLVISIVICTLDRTPKLWRQVADVRVVQPEPYYDPRLPDRAAMTGVVATDLESVIKRRGFRIRSETTEDGTHHVLGDRHQYTKLATLLTHLGLILFLLAAAVTSRFGEEQGLVVAEGESLTVQPIGTPGLLLVKNLDFQAPGFETGSPTDFTTDLAVYRDGEEIARKTIRVNDPLSIGGYTFHQNGFGPAPHVVIRDQSGAPLWDGAVPLLDSVDGMPYASMAVPGRDLGLRLLLFREDGGQALLRVQPYQVLGLDAEGQPIPRDFDTEDLAIGDTAAAQSLGISVQLVEFSDFTLLIAKADPGQGIVWLAFASLIAGITITFYLPRRRIWARIAPDGSLALVWRSDRYVDVEREFGRLLDDLVAVRRPA
ncbi:MAG TPA: cytochrome c biogenesis protein ResB [Candidatus Saccharimonadales bacterium]|nr:cytochrome c biogenesis protein ResB [Candidatus Saccharimonadales bacterium]